MREALKRLGVDLVIRKVDVPQFQKRRNEYDYDMIANRWGMSLSPGTEQRYYFGSEGRELPGTTLADGARPGRSPVDEDLDLLGADAQVGMAIYTGKLPLAEAKKVAEIARWHNQRIKSHPPNAGLTKMGTPGLVKGLNAGGILPTGFLKEVGIQVETKHGTA